MAMVKKENLFGTIDVKGKEIIAPQFQSLDYLDDYLLVNDGKGFGLMDKKGNWILPCNYSKIEFISETILRLEMNDKFGYYNIVQCQFIWREDGVE